MHYCGIRGEGMITGCAGHRLLQLKGVLCCSWPCAVKISQAYPALARQLQLTVVIIFKHLHSDDGDSQRNILRDAYNARDCKHSETRYYRIFKTNE